jgi:hypothetical protein
MLGAMGTMCRRGGDHLQAATSVSALQATARDRKNVFAALMEAMKTHSLGRHRGELSIVLRRRFCDRRHVSSELTPWPTVSWGQLELGCDGGSR